MTKKKTTVNFLVIHHGEFMVACTEWKSRDAAMKEFYRLAPMFPDVPLVVLDMATYKVVFDNGVRYA